MSKRPTIPQNRSTLRMAIDVYVATSPLPFRYRVANFLIGSVNYYVSPIDRVDIYDPYREPENPDLTNRNIPPDA